MSSSKKDSKDSSEFKVPSKFKFQEGEKVLCFHGPLIYEAKCLQCRFDEKDKTAKYHIHYSGWNKSWDEWVPESRVLKFNDTNLQKQKDLYKAQKAEPGRDDGSARKGKKAKKRSLGGKEEKGEKEIENRSSTPNSEKRINSSAATSSSQESSSDVPKRKKLKTDPTVESEEQFLSKVEIKVKIPDELKPWLVDDWEIITKSKKLVLLPARVTVDKILDDYSKSKPTGKNNSADKVHSRSEMIEGVRDYFNVMLGPQLLYKIEKKQYAELVKSHPNVSMSGLYGVIHLLRLFVKIGPALAYTKLEEKVVPVLLNHFQEFLRFIYKNKSSYYDINNDYVPVPIDYLR